MIDMQVTEAWIAIEISNDTVVMAYGPFDTNSEVMKFAMHLRDFLGEDYDDKVIVRKLRKPPSTPYWWGRRRRRNR